MFWKKSKPPAHAVPLHEIVRHFNEAAADEENFPSTIDPRIYHVQLIIEYFGDLNGSAYSTSDAARAASRASSRSVIPRHLLVGFDLAEAMLRHVPPPVSACAGSMTALPFPTGSFDCVYATESLEHAVEVDTAVAEMCRVTRPGGRIVIIDKNARQWGRLKTPEWEKWFDRKKLEKMLARHCAKVSSRPISYWEDVAPDGLFLAWLAER